MKKQKNRGITLIALIITIIVMLILVGVTVAIVVDSDIIGQAEQVGDLYKDAYANEGNKVDNVILRGGKHNTIDGYLQAINGQNTLGNVYKDEMIGQKITYSANGENDWIVFGKDENGNILITTEEPVENGFNLGGGALAWLTYEEDLQEACEVYGGTLQGKTVTARSMKMKDISGVLGIETELEGAILSFGTTEDYCGNTAAMYPSIEAISNGYWKKAEVDNEFISYDSAGIGYNFRYDGLDYEWGLFNSPSGSWPNNEINEVDWDKIDLIWGFRPGQTNSYSYLLAEKGLLGYTYREGSDEGHSLCVGEVKDKAANCTGIILGKANTTTYVNNEAIGLCNIRPIVELPPALEVVENNGVYDLAE